MSRNSAGNSSSSPTTQVPIVGRDTFLARLHTALVEHGIVVVSGVSGIGKTTPVREYSHRFAPQYQTILWLNAADDETFLADVISALQAYTRPVDMEQGVADLFQQLHTYIGTQQSALLVLDKFSRYRHHTRAANSTRGSTPGNDGVRCTD